MLHASKLIVIMQFNKSKFNQNTEDKLYQCQDVNSCALKSLICKSECSAFYLAKQYVWFESIEKISQNIIQCTLSKLMCFYVR